MTGFAWLKSATRVSRRNNLGVRVGGGKRCWEGRKGCGVDRTSLQGMVVCVPV